MLQSPASTTPSCGLCAHLSIDQTNEQLAGDRHSSCKLDMRVLRTSSSASAADSLWAQARKLARQMLETVSIWHTKSCKAERRVYLGEKTSGKVLRAYSRSLVFMNPPFFTISRTGKCGSFYAMLGWPFTSFDEYKLSGPPTL